MNKIALRIILLIVLFLSCSTPRSGPSHTPSLTTGENLFAQLYSNLKGWPDMDRRAYADLKSDMQCVDAPYSSMLFETRERDGYLYISHIGDHVAIAYFDHSLRVRDLKTFPSKMGFSAACRDGLIVTLHRNPGTGMFINTKVFVETRGSNIELLYDVK